MSEQNDREPSNQPKEDKTSPDEEPGESSKNKTKRNGKPDQSMFAVQKVKLESDGYRQLSARWQCPVGFSGQYLVLLHENQIRNYDTWTLCKENQQTECSIKFSQLKCEHAYYCEVFPEWGERLGKPTRSKVVSTGKRKPNRLEEQRDFGKTGSITATFRDDDFVQDMEMDIHWHSVIAGNNYDLIGYDLRVVRDAFSLKFWNKFSREETIFEQKQLKDVSAVTHNIKPGYKYTIYVVTLLKNLDTDKIETFEHSVTENTKLGKPKMHDKCECTDDAFIFHWNALPGSVCYDLVIWDENLKDIWFENRYAASPEKGKDFSAPVTKRDKIRSGQTCNVKVIAIAANELRSESEAKRIFLGDAKQPKNVQAVLDSSNIRCANISFDQPSEGAPIEYEILAVPAGGRGTRKYSTNTTPYLCDHLRTKTAYTFEVSANWGKSWSRKSKSNCIITPENTNTGVHGQISMIKTQAQIAKLDASHSQFNQYNSISDYVTDGSLNIGKVIHFQTNRKANRDTDIVTVTWDPPSFGKDPSNYIVQAYNVKVRRCNAEVASVTVSDVKRDFFLEEIKLKLGGTYEIYLESVFENIDAGEVERRQSEIRKVYTRPTKPKITRSDTTSDKLILKWNDAEGIGRNKYKVKLYVDDSNEAEIEEYVENPSYERIFDERLGYGKYFVAEVVAYGVDDVKNSDATPKRLIGGNYVPTNVSTSICVSDPTTQISVRWTDPETHPHSYDIEAHAHNALPITQNAGRSPFLFDGLKGGTFYRFKVIAIHPNIGRFGCWSNEEKTSPKPMQVKNVSVQPGEDPTASVKIHWDKIQPITPEIRYRVNLKSTDYEIKKSEISEDWQVVTGLPSGTKFAATVSAWNSEGYGTESEIINFNTEHERPRNVKLKYCNKDAPILSLQLNFESTLVTPIRYDCKLYLHNTEKERVSYELNGSHKYCEFFYNLQPNSEYQAMVIAVYASGESAGVSSNKLKTAPAKPVIKKCESFGELGCASRQILVQWITDADIESHEVRFRLESNGQLEQIIALKAKNEVVYNCHHESAQYLVDVRSQNDLAKFGDWSDPRTVSLAPAKLEDIFATLEDDGKISVTCSPARRQIQLSALHFMKAIYNNEVLPGDPIPCNINQPIVKWNYTPKHHAAKYQFQLWVEYQQEDGKNLKGEMATSNTIISKPNEMEVPEVELLQDNPSTDIKISWNVLENCEYQVRICNENGDKEIILKLNILELHCKYTCQRPGSVYKVSVRGIRDSVFGNWSAEKSITLVPAEVKFKCEQPSGPVNAIELEWHELKEPPKKYIVRLMREDEIIKEYCWGPQINSQKIEKPFVHPGHFYRCEIAGANDAGTGGFVSSRTYHIIWDSPGYLKAELDDVDPCHKALIKWDKADGIDMFDLHIESLDEKKVNVVKVCKNEYLFESGIPGNTYNIKLYWGYNNTMSHNFLSKTLTMKPSPPWNIRATEQYEGLLVSFDDDLSPRKSYEISVECLQCQGRSNCIAPSISPMYVSDLTPGASYIVSVTTIINDERSSSARCNHIVQTLPAPIENLEPTCMDDHVIFNWDIHQFSPRYFVQWRVENGPVVDSEISENCYTISSLKPSCAYFLRVAARNSSGDGEMTAWKAFYSRPDPPQAVTTSKDSKRSTPHFIIKIEDEIQRGKKYQIRLKPFNKPGAQNKSIVTSKLKTVVGDLTPGTAYKVYVKSLFHDKESDEVEAFPVV